MTDVKGVGKAGGAAGAAAGPAACGRVGLDEFLAPISAALGRAGAPAGVAPPTGKALSWAHTTDGLEGEALVARFVQEAEATGAVVHRCALDRIAPTVAAIAAGEIAAMLGDGPAGGVPADGPAGGSAGGPAGGPAGDPAGGSVVCANDALLEAAGVPEALRALDLVREVAVWDPRADPGANLAAAERSLVGVTVATAAVAETGTVVQECSPRCGRTLSLLPDVHVALVPVGAVRRHMLDVLEELEGRLGAPAEVGLPSQVCFITSMSCTSDIELVRVNGVHGPRRVHYVLFDAGQPAGVDAPGSDGPPGAAASDAGPPGDDPPGSPAGGPREHRGSHHEEGGAMKEYRLYINGEFVENGDREMFENVDPSTEEVLSRVPKATAADAAAAVDAAYEAQKGWAKLPAVERAAWVRKIAQGIREKAAFFAEVIMAEQGKTRTLASIEAGFVADYMDYMAEFARRIEGEVVESDAPNENIILYKEPIGVAVGILPWNFPFFLVARKMAPALVAGNTIVIKPSSDTPNCAYEFAEVVHEVGLPKGVFNMVTGSGAEVGEELCRNPKVGIVSMTGSVEVGSSIMAACAPNITKVSLELGGKAPSIVMPDADLDLAAKAIFDSRVGNTGQICNNAERCYVHESVLEEFTAKVLEHFRNAKYGPVFEDDGFDMGPLINKKQLEAVDARVRRAVEQGARVLCGGEPDREAGGGKGWFYKPTVLADCRQDMDVMHEETFGPVLPICPFKDFDEAIEFANDCEYGLASSIFTTNMDYMMRACNELKFGETYVNRWHFEAMQGFHQGVRKSGIGGADGKHGFEEYLQTHICYIDYDTSKK